MNFARASLLELPEEERRRRLRYAELDHARANSRLEEKLKALP